MQALEFTRALKEIVRDLKVKELLAILQPWVALPGNAQPIADQTKDLFASSLLSSNAAYEQLMKRADTRPILQQLSLSALYEPSRVRAVLGIIGSLPHSSAIFNQPGYFVQFYSLLEQLRSLRTIEAASANLLEAPKLQGLPSEETVLELELIEYPDQVGITPKRLQIFVSCVTDLHMNLTLLHDLKDDTLTFKYFDSGSGVLVGIAAAVPIIATLGTLLNQYWDRIRFHRYDSHDRKIESISKTLDIFDSVQQKVQKGAITEEVGKNLTHRIMRDLETLTDIGAMVPLKDATIDQRQLLTEIRNTKLLGTGEEATSSTAEATPPSSESA